MEDGHAHTSPCRPQTVLRPDNHKHDDDEDKNYEGDEYFDDYDDYHDDEGSKLSMIFD